MPHIGISITTDKSGGQSGGSYWTSIISATVENAAPTHVVLTFASPKNLVASDITIAGLLFRVHRGQEVL